MIKGSKINSLHAMAKRNRLRSLNHMIPESILSMSRTQRMAVLLLMTTFRNLGSRLRECHKHIQEEMVRKSRNKLSDRCRDKSRIPPNSAEMSVEASYTLITFPPVYSFKKPKLQSLRNRAQIYILFICHAHRVHPTPL